MHFVGIWVFPPLGKKPSVFGICEYVFTSHQGVRVVKKGSKHPKKRAHMPNKRKELIYQAWLVECKYRRED
jgi:hypothetical protein